MSSQALVASKGAPVVERRHALAIKSAINDLTLAFAMGAQRSEHDLRRTLELYERAVAGFDRRLVAEVLEWLILHNPRNPFTPTPQDLFEACKARQSQWYASTLSKYGLLGNVVPHATPTHEAPPDVEVAFLRDKITATLKFDREPLISLSDAKFNAIPHEAFPEQSRDDLLAERKARTAREQEWRERGQRRNAPLGGFYADGSGGQNRSPFSNPGGIEPPADPYAKPSKSA